MKAILSSTLLTLAVLGIGGRACGDRRSQGRRPCARLHAPGERRQDLSAGGFQGQRERRARLVPEGVHPGLHDRVQVPRGARRHDQEVQREVFHGQRRSARGRGGEQGIRPSPQCRFSASERPDQGDGQRLRSARAIAASPTDGHIYIGKDGKILAIDKDVKPATSAEDMATTLKRLGVEEQRG